MATDKIRFEEVHEYFTKRKWKLLPPYLCYRIFVKPSDPNEPPRWVYVDDDGNVDKDEFNKVKP